MSEPLSDEQLTEWERFLKSDTCDVALVTDAEALEDFVRFGLNAIQEVRRLRWEKNAEGATAVEAMEQRLRADNAEAEVERLRKDLQEENDRHVEDHIQREKLEAERDRYIEALQGIVEGLQHPLETESGLPMNAEDIIRIALDALNQKDS